MNETPNSTEPPASDRKFSRRTAIVVGATGLAAVYVVPTWLLDGSSSSNGGVIEQLADVTAPTASAATDCVLVRETTEGPYHLEGVMSRRNITEGKRGVPVITRLSVVDASTCKPIAGADVEIWHADARGEYSGFDGGNGGESDTRYLRGHQKTDASGVATFNTIFPGWYPGRAPHVHVRVHVGGNEVHTGQYFFTTALARRIYSGSNYRSRGQGWQRNAGDGIYQEASGKQAILRTRKRGGGKRGYVGYLTMGVNV